MTRMQEIQLPYLPEKAHWVTFENGHTLFYVPKRGDVFNISTWVKTGSIHENDEINGISHFLEHLMFKGTKRFKPGEFDKKMESMGAVINAATWKDFTFYYITGPKGLDGKNFESALDMHADMMLHSTLPDEEIGPAYDPEDANYKGAKRERSVVIEEIGMREDQPWTKVYNSLNHMMYPTGHPYQRDVIGTRQIIGKVPRNTLTDYYHQWYAAPTMTTIVVGDFEAETLQKMIQTHFDFTGLPQATGKALEQGPPLPEGGKRFEKIVGEYQTSFFIMGFHGPRPESLAENIALDVASYALGESRSSRFNQELIEKPTHPLFNSISSGQSTFKLGNVFFIQGNFNHPTHEVPMKQVNDELEKFLTTHPITQDELTRAIKNLKVDFAETSETVSGIAETIGESLTVVGDLGVYTDYLPTLNQLDLKTVQEVALKYLHPSKAFTSVLVPENA
ncbi:MAG: insulinase family protein [Cyanobacteria bacterium]|nr:insulinase family protein [Cyanobacteriota bacterium]